jgi:2,4'-dihydroxyacetophenone dioxygenase
MAIADRNAVAPTRFHERRTMQTTNVTQFPRHDTLLARDPQQLPWAPWSMKGAYFKLLSTDSESGRFALMIKLEKGFIAPSHRHIGAVEGLVLEGGFHYADEPNVRFTAGTYLLERDGALHQPVSPEGAVMFAVFQGPVEGLDAQGNITGRIDWNWHLKAWDAFIAAQ